VPACVLVDIAGGKADAGDSRDVEEACERAGAGCLLTGEFEEGAAGEGE
jgi:hypothetical protein